MRTLRMAWDEGAITGMFGALLKQKTVKTVCGRRVPFAAVTADYHQVACSACRHELARREQITRELRDTLNAAKQSE